MAQDMLDVMWLKKKLKRLIGTGNYELGSGHTTQLKMHRTDLTRPFLPIFFMNGLKRQKSPY